MRSTPDFSCNKCGNCCRFIGSIKELEGFADENGICKHLKGNLCNIYENRPDVCNGLKVYRKYFSTTFTYDFFLKLSQIYCKDFRDRKINAEANI